MRATIALLGGLAAGAFASSPALARGDYDNLFFVRPQATAAGFLRDRARCSDQAAHMGDNAAAYSDPQYGALSAMGSALDEDALHEGGLHRRLQQAVFTECMKRLGWTPAEPTTAETRELMKATLRHPEPLDLWLKAHEPTVETAAAHTPAAPAGASQIVKTATSISTNAPAASEGKAAH